MERRGASTGQTPILFANVSLAPLLSLFALKFVGIQHTWDCACLPAQDLRGGPGHAV